MESSNPNRDVPSVELKFWERVEHYVPVFFVALPALLSIWTLMEIYVFDTYDGVRAPQDYGIITPLSFMFSAVMFYRYQKTRLRFSVIELQCSDAEFTEAIKKTALELKWIIRKSKKYTLRAHNSIMPLLGSMITINRERDRILFNSICDPTRRASIFSGGLNKTNYEVFKANLMIVAGLKEATPKQPEKDWTLGQILFRLFAYPFSLGLIAFGISIIFGGWVGGITLLGFAVIAVGLIYIVTDIQGLVRRRRQRRKYLS